MTSLFFASLLCRTAIRTCPCLPATGSSTPRLPASATAASVSVFLLQSWQRLGDTIGAGRTAGRLCTSVKPSTLNPVLSSNAGAPPVAEMLRQGAAAGGSSMSPLRQALIAD